MAGELARSVSEDFPRQAQRPWCCLYCAILRKSQRRLSRDKLGIEKDAPDFISAQVPAMRVCWLKSHLIMTALRFIALSATCLALASCENMKKSGGTSSDPYASNYGTDGHYNPYPGQSGYASSSTPKYQTPPAPPSLPPEPEPPANPYAFSGTKKVTPSSSSSSTTKKSTASSTSAKKKSPTKKTTAKKSSGSRYTVVKGDTLSAIARKKGSSVAKIKAANGLKGDLIRLGQSLKIP